MQNQSCTREMWKEINANWFYNIYIIGSTSLLFSVEWVETRLTLLLLWCLFDWRGNSKNKWIKDNLDAFLHSCPAQSQSACLSKWQNCFMPSISRRCSIGYSFTAVHDCSSKATQFQGFHPALLCPYRKLLAKFCILVKKVASRCMVEKMRAADINEKIK